MKALLVRVGVDSTYGRWNAPMDLSTGEFIYVPIPEKRERIRHGCERPYDEVRSPLHEFGVELPENLTNRCMHLDPDFAELTYGDQGRRGNPIRSLGKGDLLAFYAGLEPVNRKGHRLVYALIGLYVVDEIVGAKSVPRARWGENAHTRREHDDSDVIVRAQKGVSGRLGKCIPIGEYRDRAYRVTHQLLETWGGLSVKDGYIQRSGTLPCFLNPQRFYRWFLKQDVSIIQRNN